MTRGGLTSDEDDVLNALAAAWNAFLRLPIEHPDQQTEFRQAIHAIQSQILARPTRRDLEA